jgi:hypothetical protein
LHKRQFGEGALTEESTDPNPERWKVTQVMLQREIPKAKKAKAEHLGGEEQEPEED